MRFLILIFVLFLGCEDPVSFEKVYGCTDPSACNFNPDATIFDDSCAHIVGCDGECYYDEGYDDLDNDGVCNDLDDCNGFYSCDNECIDMSTYCDDVNDCSFQVQNCTEDFTSLLLLDVFGNQVGYQGNEDNHTNCIFDRSITIDIFPPATFYTYIYPIPFISNINIEIVATKSTHLYIKIIDQDYNQVDVLNDGNITPGNYDFIWDGLDSNNEIVPNGYYRVIFNYENDSEPGECYYNIKKEN